jgi:hypothetical protein
VIRHHTMINVTRPRSRRHAVTIQAPGQDEP